MITLYLTIMTTYAVEMNIRNKLRLAWSIEDVSIMAEVLLKISEKAFAAFPIRDLNNIDCWLATILSQSAEHGPSFRGIGVEDHSFSIGNFTFEISCIECTSPDFDKLLFSLYDFENVTVLERAIREHSNGLLDTEFFPVFLDRIVEDSSTLCPHHSSYDPEAKPVSFLTSPADSLGFMEFASASNKPAYFNIFNGILAAFLLSFGILAKWLLSGRNRKWVQSLSRQGGRLLESQQEKDRMMKNYLDSSTHSLLFSPSIPRNVRYGVPAMIFLNLGLYLGGHFGTLSVVNLDALVAGEEFTIYEFLEFKFFESTNRTYHNGGAEMAILLWVFTGIWPYIKLILSLFLWITPPSRLSVFRRGEALLWIDALAKLSVIDIFTMLLGFAMLLVFIGGPDESLSMSDATLYALKIIVVPRAGFYCLIVAQRMSRVSSRFLLEYHDRVIDAASRDYNEKVHATSTGDSGSCSLSNSAILRHGDNSILPASSFLEEGEDDESAGGAPTGKMNEEPHADNEERSTIPLRDELRDISSTSSPSGQEMMVDEEISVHSMEGYRWGTLGALFGAVTIFIIFVIGCIFAPAISLDTSSISGLAVESGMTYEDVVSEYGVFIVISSILVQARFVLNSRADYVGLGFLLAGALVSITSVFLIQTYHFIKRKLDERRAGAVIPLYGHRGCGLPLYLHLHKWRHMEIYLISVAIGVWQLGSACSYAIHVYCEVLRQIFSVMAYIGLSDDSTAQCSRLQATLPGNLIIIGGSFLMLLLTFFFQAAAQCKKNIADSLRFVDDCDLPMMSIAWSPDKNKNSRYSHLSFSLSTDELSDDLQQRPLPSTPCTTSTTPPGTPKVQEFDNNDCDRNQQRLSATPVYLTPPRSFPLVSESSTRGLDHGRDDDELLALRQTPVNSQGFADENEFYLCYRPSDESL